MLDRQPPHRVPSGSRCGRRPSCVHAQHTVSGHTSGRSISYLHPAEQPRDHVKSFFITLTVEKREVKFV